MHPLFYKFLEATTPIQPPPLEIESDNPEAVPGLREKLKEINGQLNALGVSDKDIDRNDNGKIHEEELRLTAKDFYQKNPQNEKIKNIVEGTFKQIAEGYHSFGIRDHYYFKATLYDPKHVDANSRYGLLRSDPFFFKRALQADPNNSETRKALIAMLRAKGSLSEARKEAEEWVRLEPKNGETYAALGEVQVWEGRDTEAKVNLEKALRLDAELPRAHLALGAVFYHRKDFNRAMNEFGKAASLSSEANIEIIGALTQQGRFKDAKKHLALLASQRPDLQRAVGNALFEIELAQLPPRDRIRTLMFLALEDPELRPRVELELALSKAD